MNINNMSRISQSPMKYGFPDKLNTSDEINLTNKAESMSEYQVVQNRKVQDMHSQLKLVIFFNLKFL